jgi:hypothetical protein
MKPQRKKRNLVATLFLASVLGTSAYAFTASNTVPPSKGGDGTGAVSGYTVSNISFSIPDDPTDPTTVTFDLDAAASTVKASGSDDGTGLVSCTSTGGFGWSCDLNETLFDAENLRVAATD